MRFSRVSRLLNTAFQLLVLGTSLTQPGSTAQAQTRDTQTAVNEAGVVKIPQNIILSPPGSTREIPIQPARLPASVVVDDRTLRCAGSAFQMPGQAWNVGLTGGGFTFKAATMPGTLTPQSRAQALGLGTSGRQHGTVTLLVIDNFQPVTVPLDEDGFGVGAPPVSYSLRHGELVLAHIRSVLAGAGFTVGLDQATRPDRTILLRRLDIGSLHKEVSSLPANIGVPRAEGSVSTGTIAVALREIEARAGTGALVVNMSFALIPCNLQDVYFQYREAAYHHTPQVRLNFTAFLKAVADANLPASPPPTPAQEQAYLAGLFTHLPNTDPLLTLLRAEMQGRPALAVASSGNYEQSFETMPAAFPPGPALTPPVLGVGATDSAGHKPNPDWPDPGDVQEVGQWFHFPVLIPNLGCFVGPGCIFAALGGTQPSVATFGYRGTSFSSPTVAAALAVRIPLTLAQVSPNDPCFMTDVSGFLRLRSGAGQPPVSKLAGQAFQLILKCS